MPNRAPASAEPSTARAAPKVDRPVVGQTTATGHYDVSVACAEDQLLPSVRNAEPNAEVLAERLL
ncbi:hypothetical protein ABZ370_02110 [Streptomyces sp. NPDC005962]|uniref:hypothetical protein n=1 Tax=Streptomyces sp. NPDC005962 TaxID=3154466 RepID=UPI0033D83D27